MDWFFAKDYTGAPFEFLGPAHLIAIGIVALICLSFIFFRKAGPRAKNAFRWTLAAVLIVDELGWHAWNLAVGQWSIKTMLPLHLCSVLVFLSAYMLATKSYRIFEFAYLLGIAGALQALLTPDLGIYGYPHYRFFQTMLSHGSIIIAAVYMAVVEGFRPYPKSIARVLVGANLYMVVIFVLNQIIGSNYLYVAHKPETPSLIDMLGPWPVYILAIEAIGALFCLLVYLPYLFKDRAARRQQAAQPAKAVVRQ